MISPLSRLLPLPLLMLLLGSGSGMAAEISEKDYFTELPEVLTVTRLAQPLSETPGAVTIIDRETIRRSGARELVDVLRLVPGYLVAGWNGATPNAVYHAPTDDYARRNLVLIDGRSVYSSAYIGDTHRGMMGVLLDDIERIEVLRGSNSAAYGNNAVFGVINIITRHASDTLGGEVSLTQGGVGIADNYARFGWGDETASFRVSVGRRKDDGYGNAYDDKIVSQLHLRSDLKVSPDQEVRLSAGVIRIAAGEGFPLGSAKNLTGGNQLRTVEMNDYYLNGQWRRQLSATAETKAQITYDEEHSFDQSIHVAPPALLDFGGQGRRLSGEIQYQDLIVPSLRGVIGGGFRYENAKSKPMYATDSPVSMKESRLFGNLEWTPNNWWTLNFSGFFANHSKVGTYFSPRAMANLHLNADHTLRIGASRSVRTPTLYELYGDVRYYHLTTGAFITQTVRASGNLRPETLYSQELGYLGNFRQWGMVIDVRAFQEDFSDLIGASGTPNDFINKTVGFRNQGLEYQLRWKLLPQTEIWLNQTFQTLHWDNGDNDSHMPPTRYTTLALFQKLPNQFDLSVIYHTIGAMNWRGTGERLSSRRRIDARLAYPFRIGDTKAEVAVTVQAANSSYLEFLPTERFTFERRAFGTLRLEF